MSAKLSGIVSLRGKLAAPRSRRALGNERRTTRERATGGERRWIPTRTLPWLWSRIQRTTNLRHRYPQMLDELMTAEADHRGGGRRNSMIWPDTASGSCEVDTAA